MRILISDYGGVLGRHYVEPASSALAGALGVSVEESRELVSERSEQGQAVREDAIDEVEFWTIVAAKAHSRISVTHQVATDLSTLWAKTYLLDTDVLRTLQRVRPEAVLGLLTNIDRARSAFLEDVVGINALVDVYLPSFHFRAIKPHIELWTRVDRHLKERYGHDAAITYVDDRQSHVNACSAVGWRGILFEHCEALAVQLTVEGFPPVDNGQPTRTTT